MPKKKIPPVIISAGHAGATLYTRDKNLRKYLEGASEEEYEGFLQDSFNANFFPRETFERIVAETGLIEKLGNIIVNDIEQDFGKYTDGIIFHGKGRANIEERIQQLIKLFVSSLTLRLYLATNQLTWEAVFMAFVGFIEEDNLDAMLKLQSEVIKNQLQQVLKPSGKPGPHYDMSQIAIKYPDALRLFRQAKKFFKDHCDNSNWRQSLKSLYSEIPDDLIEALAYPSVREDLRDVMSLKDFTADPGVLAREYAARQSDPSMPQFYYKAETLRTLIKEQRKAKVGSKKTR